jgi:hypothetical protein
MRLRRMVFPTAIVGGALLGGLLATAWEPREAQAACGQDGFPCANSSNCYTDSNGNKWTNCGHLTWDPACGCYVGTCLNGVPGCIHI